MFAPRGALKALAANLMKIANDIPSSGGQRSPVRHGRAEHPGE